MDVRRVAAREVQQPEASRILRRAADSGNRELIEPLKAVVAAGAKESDHGLGMFLALHALWQFGEPRGYFLRQLEGYRDHPWLAHDAILVLARDPDDELMERLKPIEADAKSDRDSRMWNAVSSARRARDVIDTYRRLADDDQRVDLLLKHAGSTWSPIGGMASDPIDVDSPLPFWARKELTRLSPAHGPLIARRLAIFDVGWALGTPEDAPRYVIELRDYIAQFLPKEVKAAYEQLKRQGSDARGK